MIHQVENSFTCLDCMCPNILWHGGSKILLKYLVNGEYWGKLTFPENCIWFSQLIYKVDFPEYLLIYIPEPK